MTTFKTEFTYYILNKIPQNLKNNINEIYSEWISKNSHITIPQLKNWKQEDIILNKNLLKILILSIEGFNSQDVYILSFEHIDFYNLQDTFLFDPNLCKVVREHYIPSFKFNNENAIPAMFFYRIHKKLSTVPKGTDPSKKDLSKMTKDATYNSYLYPYFDSIFQLHVISLLKGIEKEDKEMDEEEVEDENGKTKKIKVYNKAKAFNKFYEENKKSIDGLRRLFEYDPKKIGAGSDGWAFDVGKNFVLKLFTNEYLYNTTKQSLQRLHNSPELSETEAMIYDVGVLGKINNKITIYYYIIEKMDTVWSFAKIRDDFKSLLRGIKSIIIDYGNTLKELKNTELNSKESLEKINKISKDISDYISNHKIYKLNIYMIGKSVSGLKPEWVFLLVKEIILKFLSGRCDLHIGNVGVTKNRKSREFRYFDPAFEGLNSSIHLPPTPTR